MINVIYLVTRLMGNDGPISQAYNLATGFKAIKDVNFQIVCISNELTNRTIEKKFLDAGIKVVRMYHKGTDVIGCVKHLKAYIKENNIHIVHSSGVRPDMINALLGNCVKHITTVRSEPLRVGEKMNVFIGWSMAKLMLWSMRRMDKVIACSESLADVIRKTHKMDCVAVQNAVDIDLFKAVDADEKMAIRNRLSLPTDKKVILYLGSLIPRKNINYLVRAYKKATTDCLLVLIGDYNGAFENIYKKENDEKVLFLGQKAPLEYLQCADYTISASLSEGLPNSTLESLACGVPMILSDIDPHKEIMRVGDFGVMFNAGKDENLQTALDEIAKKNHTELVNNCVEAANGRFSKYQLAKNYLKEYNAVK